MLATFVFGGVESGGVWVGEGGWARSSVYGWRVVFSGVEEATRSSIVGWRLRIDSRVALFWLLGGWRGGGGGAY